MNRKYNILSGALLLLVSGGCFQSCQEDEIVIKIPDKETLIAEGKYLAARSGDEFKVVDPTDEAKPFPVGTPYRLLAFSKAYDENNPDDETPATHMRFNKVAWEGKTPADPDVEGMRFINIDSDPDKWFGFSALAGEDATGTDGRVSLDYYGFTYGDAAGHDDSYIPVEGCEEGKQPDLALIKRTETVVDDDLADLMRGVLLNQNIKTAGKDKTSDGAIYDNQYAQSILRFRHCFSKLHFQVSQQGSKDDPEKPVFTDLQLEGIEVTGSYSEGSVYLQSGKVELNTAKATIRNLKFTPSFKRDVTVRNADAGEMLIFPSDGGSLTNMPENMTEGYDIGLKIKVRSTVREDIENMLANTESPNDITSEEVDGKTWYYGTIVKPVIPDYYNAGNPLRLKQDAAYMLIIVFQKDAVRIITVIPQVEEWLNGEGSPQTPWDDQYIGQPQMFDNVVWSDRNLGADHYDPRTDVYELTVGYFYQSGRNIPYYPFDPRKATVDPLYPNLGKVPDISTINKQEFSNQDTDWTRSSEVEIDEEDNEYGSCFKFFPIVDKEILKMNNTNTWTIYNNVAPRMAIPETTPEEYYDFMRGTNADATTGLSYNQDMHWEKGAQNQPVSGVWALPTSEQFLTIFPSTPHAGNITMQKGGNNKQPMNWGSHDFYQTASKTLRVTVPFYTPGMQEEEINWKKRENDGYMRAWRTLRTYEDKDEDEEKDVWGTTHLDNDNYSNGSPGSDENKEVDMNGDPEDGYASVYVISREEGSSFSLVKYVKDTKKLYIKEWGTIYGIKRAYTPQAYRMRWRALISKEDTRNPCIYIEICRYRCNDSDVLTEKNYKDYDWDHPAATLYFPIGGLGDWSGQYINFGTECQYATSDPIIDGKTSAVQIKITGNNAVNAYIAIVKGNINRNFGKQIRPIISGGGW